MERDETGSLASEGQTCGQTIAAITDEQTVEVAALTQSAFDAYFARDFQLAGVKYEQVLGIRADDQVAQIMGRRAREYAQHPPPEDWTGVQVMTTK